MKGLDILINLAVIIFKTSTVKDVNLGTSEKWDGVINYLRRRLSSKIIIS